METTEEISKEGSIFFFDDVRVTDMRLKTTEEGKLEPTNAGCRCHAQY